MSNYESAADFLQGHAEEALERAATLANRISVGGFIPLNNFDLDYEQQKPAMAPPPQFSDLFPGADTSSAEVIRLNGEVEKWIEKYFPEMNGPLRESPDQWACKIITGSDPYGDSKAVIDLIWHEARDRAYRAANTETRTLAAVFSERGFQLPPGALVQMTEASEVRASQAIADVNRAESIKMAEIKVDLVKFAEEQAIRLKLGLMDSLRAFYMAWIALPDKDIERARVRAQAQASLYGALSSYYNVELGFEQLRLRAAETDLETKIGLDRNKIAAFAATRSHDALASASRGFADVSSAAANAQSSLAAEITSGV
ncbi:hypothetical protein [Pseudomonas anguilliseptica]|uniref:hypothetical protein n=1 Tax=Pseudomonas anguilliseptica TaxID=53406 RepID=UPI0022AE7C69|nr:hypothetical protein [Pseudomonas anguilliseptica]MCZ4321465.1 hypothetical protein [Pseudomonas anguilliseptica]